MLTEATEMSDNSTVIAGVVVDAEGHPVEEARVYFVEGPIPLPDIAALTDRSGRFALSAPGSGTYQLGVASEGAAGFMQKTTTVEVVAQRDVNLEFRLDTEP
jgi:Carboxypeptidase regulatory-like domain